MSRRQNEGGGGKKNPSQRYLNWSSDNKTLSYYDKDAKENVLVKLPYKFAFLAERHTVGGWDDRSSSNIYANEVKFISKEPISVKSTKGGLLVSGIYKDMKEKVGNLGGHYQKSVYVYNLDTDQIEKVSIKGSACQSFGDFMTEIRNKKFDFVINLVGGTDEKKGKIKYSKPIFELGDKLSEEVEAKIEAAYEYLEEYFGSPTATQEDVEEYVEGVTDAEPIGGDDDLPF